MRALRGAARPCRALPVVLIFATLVLVGCGGDDSSDGASDKPRDILAELQHEKTVRIAISNEPPYTKVNADGTVGGLMIDTVREVMKRLDVPNLTPTVTTYDSMIPGLLAKQWDIVAGGLFMNDDRCKQVLFSLPVIVAQPALAVKPGNPHGIDSYAWFKDNREKIGLLAGSFEQNYALEKVGIPKNQEATVPDLETGIQALSSGRAAAIAAQDLSLAGSPSKSKFESVLVDDGPLAGAGEAFRPEDKAFRDEFDRVFKEIQQDGTYAKLAEKNGIDPDAAMTATRGDLAKGCEK